MEQTTIDEIWEKTSDIVKRGNGDAVQILERFKNLSKQNTNLEIKKNLDRAILIINHIIDLRNKLEKANSKQERIRLKRKQIFLFLNLNVVLILLTINLISAGISLRLEEPPVTPEEIINYNVNSSGYWDNLNSPLDINVEDLGDGSEYIKSSTLSWNRSGSVVFLINISDNVSIGTPLSTHKLTVVGNQNLTGNLTLGQRIIFELGEIIDNMVDGWVGIIGNLTVTGDLNISGDLNVSGNATFLKDVTIDGTLFGGSPVKIDGINISNNLFMLEENRNSSSRFTLSNLNTGSNATAIISAINDVGGSMSIGIGSSNFMVGNTNYENITALFSKSRGKTIFANFFNQMFLWLYNPSDDGDPNNLVELMRLDEGGLNVSVFNTGDVLLGDIDARFGQDYGAIAIGDVELFISNISLSGLNLNGTFVTRNRNGESNIKFAWVGKNNKVRLAIPKEGTAFALYNPRSEMIGGELGQAFDDGIINCTAQGYRFIDCSTDVTGADLGVQDDIEFWGALYGGNGTWNVSDEGNLDTLGNITSSNLFISQYVFAHNNATMALVSANVWANITFDQEVAEIKKGISHTFNDNTNHTFTINQKGIYDIDFNFDAIDTSASSTDIDVAGRVVYSNGTEILGSVFETDITKKNIEIEISHSMLAKFEAGDKIVFQFTATDVDVEISTHGTFGDHPESATIRIEKVANL